MTRDLVEQRGSCLRKKRYPTEGVAERVKKQAEKARGVLLRHYHCDACFGFHLSSMKVGRG